MLWGRGDACQAVSLWPLPPLRLVEICAGAAVEGAQDTLVLAGLLDTSRLPLAAGVAWTVGAGAGGLRGVSGVWLTRARPRAHAGASVGAGAGARFGGMAFVSKEVHEEQLWRLSGGGLADWLTGWLAGLLVSSCPWLSGREASRGTKVGQGRAWKGGVGVCICMYACGRDGRDGRRTRPQIWPDPDLTAMQGHARPCQT